MQELVTARRVLDGDAREGGLGALFDESPGGDAALEVVGEVERIDGDALLAGGGVNHLSVTEDNADMADAIAAGVGFILGLARR